MNHLFGVGGQSDDVVIRCCHSFTSVEGDEEDQKLHNILFVPEC